MLGGGITPAQPSMTPKRPAKDYVARFNAEWRALISGKQGKRLAIVGQTLNPTGEVGRAPEHLPDLSMTPALIPQGEHPTFHGAEQLVAVSRSPTVTWDLGVGGNAGDMIGASLETAADLLVALTLLPHGKYTTFDWSQLTH